MPPDSPVCTVIVFAAVSLLVLKKPEVPRLNAIRLSPSSYQFFTGASPTKLWKPTMPLTPV